MQSFTLKRLEKQPVLIVQYKLKNKGNAFIDAINLLKYDSIYVQFSNSSVKTGFIYQVRQDIPLQKAQTRKRQILRLSNTSWITRHKKRWFNLQQH